MIDPVITITVPTFNRLELTKRTLFSVKKHTRTPHLLVVVDNGSTDGTPEFLVRLKEEGLIDRLILFRRNMGVSCAANMGFDAGPTPLYMKLDNDMEVVRPNWLGPLIALWCDNPEVGLIGPRLPGSGHPFETVRLPSGAEVLAARSSLSGAALVIARGVFDRLGYFSEDYGTYGEEDADYSHRAKNAGFLLAAFEAAGVVEHLGEPRLDAQSYVGFKLSERGRNTNPKGGVSLFKLMCYLYNQELLPLFAPRKYLTVPAGGYFFEARTDPGYAVRRKFILECKKVIDAVPEPLWDTVLADPAFVAGLARLKRHVGA